jgi:transposase
LPSSYDGVMAAVTCLGCLERDARLAALERRLAELEARLAANTTNSGIPPSANPPDAPKLPPKKRSRRKPGAQPGHPPHLKRRLPPERIDRVVVLAPTHCDHCQQPLPALGAPDDPPPTWHQVAELPPVAAEVVEYRGEYRTCSCCGTLNHQPIPADIKAHSVGARFAATLAYLTGCHQVSKRGLEEIAAAVFDAPVSLGTVANLEQEMSAALANAHQQAVEEVRAAEIKGADETSWKQAGKLCWLWAAATATVAAFVIHRGRGLLGLAALLGAEINGILCSDRWHVYNQVPPSRRQVCWAHLKRDFQKIVDRGGPGAAVGRQGKTLVKKVFAAWHRFREGTITRADLQALLAPIERRMSRVLIEGYCGEDPKVEAFCDNVLSLEDALWTFARVEGVEPTNNMMERLLRRAVLWRKRSFGSWSAAGCRFVERILTVVQTRRLQERSVLQYLHDALVAHRAGLPSPKLIPLQ